MAEAQSELVAVKLDEGWFLSLRKGNPSHGLLISEDAARLLNAATALLLACRTARVAIHECHPVGNGKNKSDLLAQSALVQLDTAIRLVEGDSQG